MPSASAPAAAISPASPLCWAARAKVRPTAMPSGMLCSVTASTSRVERRNVDGRPSACAAPRCRWGSRPSSASMSRMPSTKPPAAGTQPMPPAASASSMAGMSRLHTDAAIITPAANPRKIRCMASPDRRRRKNTIAAPSDVIKKVKPVPAAAQISACVTADHPAFSPAQGRIKNMSLEYSPLFQSVCLC